MTKNSVTIKQDSILAYLIQTLECLPGAYGIRRGPGIAFVSGSMTDFSWNNLWQLALSASDTSYHGDEILKILRESLPIESLSLMVFHHRPVSSDQSVAPVE